MASLILINGEEEFLIERTARDEAAASIAEETVEYNFPDDLESYLYDSQAPFNESQSRTFICWNCSDVPNLPEGNKDLLIAVAASAKKNLVDKRAKRTHNFPKFKSFDDNNDFVKWILREGERLNIDLSRVATALFVSCGSCLRKISSEIDKLAVLSPKSSVVRIDEAKSVLCFSAELNPKQIIDAVCEGHTPKALAFYDKMQEMNDETGWIIAFMQRHVLQHLRLAILAELKTPENKIAEILGIHPFVFKKTLLPKLGLWSQSLLKESLNALCSIDLAHKRGSNSARFCLETEIIRLSEEAKKCRA